MRITSVTPMKNEGPFILEWFAYHHLIGFNDMVVFTNDCSDGTDMMLERMDELGLLRHLPNPSTAAESTNHHWMVMRYVNTMPRLRRSDYVMSFDVDEFLCINVGDGTLSALLDTIGDAQVFSACQLNFGVNGQEAYDPSALVMEQFTRTMLRDDTAYEKSKVRGIKSLTRRDAPILRISNHSPEIIREEQANVRWLNGSGQPMPPELFAKRLKSVRGEVAGYEVAQLNHYALRSMENFLMKSARGDANHADSPIEMRYFKGYDSNELEDTRILRWAAPVREMVDELLRDPELAYLHDASIRYHQDQIARTRETPEGAAFMRKMQKYHYRTWPDLAPADWKA